MRIPLALGIAALLALPSVSSAHPETGLLPDAIAETEYKIVLEINPRDLQTRNRLGMVYYRKNRLKEAAREFSEVLKIAPKDFDANDGMGVVRLREGKSSEALAWLQTAVSLNGEDTMVHHSLGLALEQLGRYREAEASYRRGLAVSERLLRRPELRDKEVQRKQQLLASLQSLQTRMKSQGR